MVGSPLRGSLRHLAEVSSADILDKLPADLNKVDILVNNAGLVYGTDHVGDMCVSHFLSEDPAHLF